MYETYCNITQLKQNCQFGFNFGDCQSGIYINFHNLLNKQGYENTDNMEQNNSSHHKYGIE